MQYCDKILNLYFIFESFSQYCSLTQFYSKHREAKYKLKFLKNVKCMRYMMFLQKGTNKCKKTNIYNGINQNMSQMCI